MIGPGGHARENQQGALDTWSVDRPSTDAHVEDRHVNGGRGEEVAGMGIGNIYIYTVLLLR